MISFRYHVVTIVAVFLALAVGIALGGGPLSELGRSSNEANERVSSENQELSAQLESVSQVSEFQDAFGNKVVPADLGGVLDGQSVAILTMPGASSSVVKGLTEQINRAKGTVAGTYAAQPALVDPGNKALVDTLGAQLVETLDEPGVPEGAATYVRMGGLLGRSIAATGDDDDLDQDAQSIRSSLAGAEMLAVSDGGESRADLVVVVLGGEPEVEEGADKLLASLFAGIASAADSVVVAGTTRTSDSGILRTLRDNPEFTEAVSSVDSVQTRLGQIVTAYALGRTGEGKTGQFGANGADGALPGA